MENITLILSDLDGTLFHDDKSISAYTKEVIKKTQDKGILFGISTSRALSNASKFIEGINPDILIMNGGGTASVNSNRVYSCEFSVEEINTLIKSTFEILGNDAVISVDNDKGLYSNSREELGDKFWTFCDFSDFDERAMKMCVKTQDKDVVTKIVSSIGIEKIDALPFSDIPWFKLSKKNATKENAIAAVCEHLGILPERIVAFGDDYNDIGMLKLCGKGVAMKNAIDEVRKIADEICLSNEEDGVADWIEKHILLCSLN